MLYFHKNNDQLGKEIAEHLANMSAAHKVIENDGEESYLIEDESVFKGKQRVLAFLEQYGKLLNSQQLVTGDACYVDPETGMSCEI